LELEEQFAQGAAVSHMQPHATDQRRMALGIVKSLEVEESSPDEHGDDDPAALDGEGRREGSGAHHRQV